MGANTLTLTAGGTLSVQVGYAEANTDYGGAPFGSLSPITLDGNTVGYLDWAFASSNNSSLRLSIKTLDPTNATPPNSYITSVAFTGDTGPFTLLGSNALTDVYTASPSGAMYKEWIWNHLNGFSPNTQPFTIGSMYTVTVTTAPSNVPSVAGLSLTAALAALASAGFLTTLQQSYSSVVAAGTIITQNPTAGAIAPAGTNVIITMSAGPAPSAGMGGDIWGATGGDGLNAVSTAGPPLGQNLAYAVQPDNAVYAANQSVLAALALGVINQGTPAYLVPSTPKVGA